jgi:hypothetical protein
MPRAILRYPDTGRCPSTQGILNVRKIALEIRKLAFSLAVLSAILLPALYAAPVHAVVRINHTWVSHSGSDANTCTSVSPCATFTQALSVTQAAGVVSCLDSGSFGLLTITFEVTIDCNGTTATPGDDSGFLCNNNMIVINAPGNIVTLRGLLVDGRECLNSGIVIQVAGAVNIEDSVIENFPNQGILDARTTGYTTLAIKNTVVRHNAGAGIVVAAAPKNSVVIENVQSLSNAFGIAIATGNNVVINRSVMSENRIAGIEADPGAYVFVDNTEISQNASYGIYAAGTVGLANSDIAFNTSGISGTTMSYGNNRLFLNGPGTAPTPVGATSTDFGQQ